MLTNFVFLSDEEDSDDLSAIVVEQPLSMKRKKSSKYKPNVIGNEDDYGEEEEELEDE